MQAITVLTSGVAAMRQITERANEALGDLRSLVDSTPPFEDVVTPFEDHIQIDTNGDEEVEVFGIYKEAEVSVARMTGRAGASTKPHRYPSVRVWFGIIRGSVKIQVFETESGEVVASEVAIDARHVAALDDGCVHRVVFLEESEIIVMTMPADEGLPDAGQNPPR